ncbi:MAG TPA: prolyl oligopeptidase family serine peptidase [Candidatus Brocadiia bacterium]|nr:prolyl oligopeptidase family serine peptidase [Candidatus Brocadiia bacterium]
MFPNLPLDFRAHHYMDFSIQLQAHVYARSEAQFHRWERHKDAIANVAQAKQWQQHIRETALSAIGGLPPSDTHLNPRLCGELKGDGFRIEKVIYESRPGVFVTSALYVPQDIQGQTAAVLFVCGHAEEAKAYPNYQAVCQRLARNGLVVLAVDPPGQGERRSYLDSTGRQIVQWGTTEHDYAGLQCWWLGQSSARYFIHDAMRGIDYLETRPEVDPKRIGVTGNSGGGTQSTWLMMTEPRLAAAAPGTFVMRRAEYMWTGQAQDSEQVIPSGTLNGLDHEDFMIAMVPRPVKVLAVDYDYFCLEGALASVERARRIYRIFGCEDKLSIARDRCTHEYSPVLARSATEFFVTELLGLPAQSVDHSNPKPFPVEQLWCTQRGQALLDTPCAKGIFDGNLERYNKMARRESDSESQASKASVWLNSAIHRFRKPCALNPRWPWDETVQDIRVCQGFWFTEPGICNTGFLLRPATTPYKELVIAVFDRGTLDISARRQWVEDMAAEGHAVLILNLRGMGNILPRALNPVPLEERYGTVFKLICDLVAIGDDLASMRVYDLLRAVQLAFEDPMIDLDERPLRLFGAGLGGFYSYLAGALEPRISKVEIEDALFSLDSLMRTRYYRDDRLIQATIFGMAAEMDLPELQPLFAGRQLIVRRPRDGAGAIIEEWDQPAE